MKKRDWEIENGEKKREQRERQYERVLKRARVIERKPQSQRDRDRELENEERKDIKTPKQQR